MLPRRARYATGKERTMDDGRKDAAAGMEADSSSPPPPPPPPPLPGIRIMQPSFFTRSRNEDTRGADVRKIYLWDEIWRRGEPKQNTEFRNSSGGGQTLRSCSCAPSPSLSSRRNPISQFPLPFPRALFERE